MLILTPEYGEWIQIGDNVRLQVTRRTRNKPKLCFDAPRDVRITRDGHEPHDGDKDREGDR